MHLDMLTADHLHSPSRSPKNAAEGNCPALQMPLSVLGSLLRKQSLSPFAPIEDKTEPLDHGSVSTIPTANSPMKADSGVQSSPGPSRRNSTSSGASTARTKKNKRPKTIYKLAQPPHPRGKLHIRPKVVLQLQQVVAARRPKPAFEVIPYTICIPFSSRFKVRTFRGRSLTAADLLILKAEEYQQHNEEDRSDEERFGSREVVGVICPGKEDKSGVTKTEILMENGQSWEVTRTPNGGYEFVYVDDHGLTLRSRWVAKPPHLRRQSSMTNASQGSPTEDRKFTFSTISQNSRRHPIIATMTRDRIEVSESYMMPSATSPSTPSAPTSALPTPVATPSSIDMSSFLEPERLPIETGDALKSFIVASGVWVAFQENWSSMYSKGGAPPPLVPSNTFRTTPNRTVSMTYIDTPRSASPTLMDEYKRTIPRIIRTHTQFLHSKTSEPGSPVSPIKTRARRSNSTGNTDLFRNGSLRKRFGLALEDQPVPETEEERHEKRSMEILRVKELALQPPPTLSLTTSPLSPIPSIEPPTSPSLEPSPTLPDARARKTRSAYDPVPTAGMWDSGIVEAKGTLRTRPTSLVVMNDKKMKAQRKEQRSKSRDKKEKKEKKEKDGRRKSEGLRHLFAGMFRKERHTA